MAPSPRPVPLVPISWGELLDKITILEIKAARILDPAACANVERELSLLRAAAVAIQAEPGLALLIDALRDVNLALWQIEDDIRAKEAEARFDASFITLARSVYLMNDRRSAIKRQINTLLCSGLVEEKSHAATHDAIKQ